MASPLRPPPLGIASDFASSGPSALSVVVAAGICLPMLLLCASARILARKLARTWVLQDYFFCFSFVAGIAFISYTIPLTLTKPYGNHVWDIDTRRLTKPWLLRLLTFAVFTGPILWLSKTTVILHLRPILESTRRFKGSSHIIVPATGLIYALYTCTVSTACAPRPDSDTQSYINGFQQDACSGSEGVNMILGMIMALVNVLVDLYLVVATFSLILSINLDVQERRFIWLARFMGIIECVCSILGLAYRIKSYVHDDLTGYRININTALILEVSISLMIPCMSSFHAIHHHYTYIDLNERVTIGTSTPRYNSAFSGHKTLPGQFSQYPSHTPSPLPEAPKKIWRKTHMSVEELPFRKASIEFYRRSPLALRDSKDSRMKALPPTPLPLASRNNSVANEASHDPKISKAPKTPKTPNSIRSMRLTILFEGR